MKLKNLQLSQLLPADFPLILLSSKPWNAYKDGKPTDEVLGFQYEILSKGGNYERFRVKIAGSNDIITNDKILAEKKEIVVTLQNAVCTPYVDSAHQIQLSVKADSMKTV